MSTAEVTYVDSHVPALCEKRRFKDRVDNGHLPITDGTCLWCGLYLPDVRFNSEGQTR